MGLLDRIWRQVERVGQGYSVWQAVVAVVSIGGISAGLASASDWIAQYGPIGWWAAALVGAIIAIAIGIGIAWLRNLWVRAGAIRRWSRQVSSINPLDSEFSGKRIRVADLMHPITKTISNKRLINCELVGPANLYIVGDRGFMNEVDLRPCDFVEVLPNKPINNFVRFEDVQMLGGSIWQCTLFVHAVMARKLKKDGATFLTPSSNQQNDTPSPPDTAQKKPQ